MFQYLGKIPNELQKLNLKVYSQKKCILSFWNVRSSHICAFSEYGQGACHVSINIINHNLINNQFNLREIIAVLNSFINIVL